MVDSWALPGGHIENHESAKDGAIRELFEETGVKTEDLIEDLVHVKITSSKDRKKNVLFAGIADSKTEAGGNSDLNNVTWVNVDSLPDLAFNNNQHVFDCLNQLYESKLDY